MLDNKVSFSYPHKKYSHFLISPLYSLTGLEIQQAPELPNSDFGLTCKSRPQLKQSERERDEKMPTLTSTSSFLNPLTLSAPSKTRNLSSSQSIFTVSPFRTPSQRSRTTAISCNVALKQDSPTATASTSSSEESEASPARIGAKVKVKVPLKVYHVPKVPEIDLFDMEGTIKQYVAIWKGKRISANLPFKVEFFAKVEGRDEPVKVVAHLKEDEFDYLD